MVNDFEFKTVEDHDLLQMHEYAQEEINPQSRSFLLCGEIDEDMTKDFHEFIQNDMIYKQEHPIYIYINSIGGDLSCALTIMEMIRHCKTEVITITAGACFSGAVFSQIVGHRRYCYDTASFLIHPIKTFTEGSSCDLEESIEQLDILRKTTYEIFLKYTNCTEELLDEIELKKKNFYLTAEEAQRFGLVDKIIK